ncbi:MAG: SH3 domain-containing protein, partial [Caldilineaceae bacterium]|nr:SH3 domain-containing protein [Caldilineaceae bacterium]
MALRARVVLLLALLLVTVAATGCVMQPVVAEDAPPVLDPSMVPVIAVAPIVGRPGTTVFVSGAGWLPEDAVFLNLSTPIGEDEVQEVTVSATVVAADGRFSASFLYPYEEPWGSLEQVSIIAYSVDSDGMAEAIFSLDPNAPLPAPSGTVPPTATVATATPSATPSATPTPTPASADGYGLATVQSAGLNMRAGPSSSYPIVRALVRGDELMVLGQSSDTFWLYVMTLDGRDGWVARRFTDFRETVPTVAPAGPPVTVTRAPGFATATPTPAMGGQMPGGSGWRAEYYNNMSLTGMPTLVRTDRDIHFDWGYGAPDPRIQADYFSARWVQ